MTYNYINVSGTGVQALRAASTNTSESHTVERLLICNTDTTDIAVNLYLQKDADIHYLLKSCSIPVGVTLDFLNGIPFTYNADYVFNFSLTDAAYTADIIFNGY